MVKNAKELHIIRDIESHSLKHFPDTDFDVDCSSYGSMTVIALNVRKLDLYVGIDDYTDSIMRLSKERYGNILSASIENVGHKYVISNDRGVWMPVRERKNVVTIIISNVVS